MSCLVSSWNTPYSAFLDVLSLARYDDLRLRRGEAQTGADGAERQGEASVRFIDERSVENGNNNQRRIGAHTRAGMILPMFWR